MRRIPTCVLAAALLISTSCRDAPGSSETGLGCPPEIPPASSIRAPTSFVSTKGAGQQRVDEAAERRAVVLSLFERAKVTFPPGQLLLRAFKMEKHLEVWAASSVE